MTKNELNNEVVDITNRCKDELINHLVEYLKGRGMVDISGFSTYGFDFQGVACSTGYKQAEYVDEIDAIILRDTYGDPYDLAEEFTLDEIIDLAHYLP